MGIGVHKIVEQMRKTNLENQVKTIILEKWLIMTLNGRDYEHPPVEPPNLGANLTSFKCRERPSHTHHELILQIDED